jgi:hypothetical protein
MKPSDGMGISRILLDNRDIAMEGVLVGRRQVVSGVQLTVSNSLAILQGRVMFQHAPDARFVAAVSEGPVTWLDPGGRYVAVTRLSQAGTFEFRGLAPGLYRVVALPSVDRGRITDPDMLRQWTKVGQRATVTSQERTEIEISAVFGG